MSLTLRLLVAVLLGSLVCGLAAAPSSASEDGRTVDLSRAASVSGSGRPASGSSAARYAHTTRGAYRWAYHAVMSHYIAHVRPTWSWPWTPHLPHWISDGIWWFKKGATCAIGVASFVALGGSSKVIGIMRKIKRLAKTDKEVRQARTAIRNLGGFAKAMKVLGRYASSKGKDVSKVEKKNVTKMVTAGGAVVADALGVKACFELVSRTL